MDNSKRFSSRVDNYVKYRPSYPQLAINYLFENGITNNSTVGDIASGTGILSKLLIEKVNTLYCIEPNTPMREYCDKQLSSYNNYISINASAEKTTLKDNSLDALTVAQAFHWFDMEKCKLEFNRVLKPNSKIFLIWNNRLKNTSFLIKYDQLLKDLSNDYNKVNHQNIKDSDFDYFFDNKWEKISFDNYQVFNFEQFLGRVESSSYTPEKKDVNYSVFYKAIKELFDDESNNGVVNFNYKTEIISNVN